MQQYSTALPPLELLVAFEAAARHSSFTLAGQELNVTQSAISQRIRNLEKHLGVALFERGHRSVRLTDRGHEFFNSVTLALDHLLGSANRIKDEDNNPALTIATDESVAAMWLMPRFARFRDMHPDLCVRLIASDDVERCFQEDIDLAVVHGDGGWPGYDCEPFFQEEVFPVCSESYLRRRPDAMSPEGLPYAALLDLEYKHWHWMNWGIWLTETGLDLPLRKGGLRSNSYPLLIDAARRGQGVALGWRHFVDDDLMSGSLVCPIKKTVKTRFAYYLIRRHNVADAPEGQACHDWLIHERNTQPLFPI
jgi:LysR family transcriptional regulator, glycine cleavage system transcriptional activator